MTDESLKRSAPINDQKVRKKQKQRNWFQRPRAVTIEPGDAGIFVTCNRNIERRCVGEVKDLFDEYAQRLYGESYTDDVDEIKDNDVDTAIAFELAEKPKDEKKLFENVTLDQKCILFFRTRPPLSPITFVHRICSDAAATTDPTLPPPLNPPLRTRFAKRLTPLSHIGPANEAGLEQIARKALAPEFHDEPVEPKTFAVRVSIRDHGRGLEREGVIRLVAGLVGGPHKVDLKGAELVVIVEVYRNVVGMSVVRDFERLKRFNLSEIYAPTQKPEVQSQVDDVAEAAGVSERKAADSFAPPEPEQAPETIADKTEGA